MTILSLGNYRRKEDVTQSTAYRFFVIGAQVAGGANVPTDRSGNGNDGVLSGGMADADLWANAGYFSTIDGTDEAIEFPLAAHSYDMSAGESLIISFVINAAVLAASDGILGSFAFGGEAGFRAVSFSASGILRGEISDGTTNVTLTDIDAPSDGTDHTVTWMIDGITKLAYSYLDGVLVGAAKDVSAVTGSTIAAGTFNFGNDTNTAAGKSYAAKWKNIHYKVLSDALPSNASYIAQLLHTRGAFPLSTTEVGV